MEWFRVALKTANEDDAAFAKEQLSELQKRYSLLEQRLRNLMVEKLDGNISGGDFNKIKVTAQQEQRPDDKSDNESIRPHWIPPGAQSVQGRKAK